jgi:outer membrane protein assembly factor BamB
MMSPRLRVAGVLLAVGLLGCLRPDAAWDAAVDATVKDPLDVYCYGSGGTSLPTCADGAFLYWDKLCMNTGAWNQMCTYRGDGRCRPFCDAGGGCPTGQTCGEIALYRCTDYCGAGVARVCFPEAETPVLGCERFWLDAGTPPDAAPDASIDAGPCIDGCPTAGTRECLNSLSRTCVADWRGCRSWSPYVACPSGSCASGDSCSAVAEHPWPMFRNSRDHVGRSRHTGAGSATLRWSIPLTPGKLIYSSPAVAADGTIYVGGEDSKVYAIDSNGTVKWAFATGDLVMSSPAIGADGTVYVGSHDNKVYAISPNGTLRWTFPTGDKIYSSPTLGTDGAIYIGSYDHNAYALEPNGTLRWSFPTGNYVEASPAIGADGTVYVASDDGYLYAVSATGSLMWKFQTNAGTWGSPALGSDGTVYLGVLFGTLWAVAPNGTKRWSFVETGNIATSPGIGVDGTVYFGCTDASALIYAFTPAGATKWSFKTGDQVQASPAIGADGVVYFASEDGKLYALSPQGAELWSYDIGHRFIMSSPAIGADGTIYFGDYDGNFYAVGN